MCSFWRRHKLTSHLRNSLECQISVCWVLSIDRVAVFSDGIMMPSSADEEGKVCCAFSRAACGWSLNRPCFSSLPCVSAHPCPPPSSEATTTTEEIHACMSEGFPGSAFPLPVEKMSRSETEHWLLTSQQHNVTQFTGTPALSLLHDL